MRPKVVDRYIKTEILNEELAAQLLRNGVAYLEVLQTDVGCILEVAGLCLLVLVLSKYGTGIVSVGIGRNYTIGQTEILAAIVVLMLTESCRPPHVAGDTPEDG